MRIENIIDDIKKDITELSEKLAALIRKDDPTMHFSIQLPDIEELATIKSIVLRIEGGEVSYLLNAQVHTHNGNRVFENATERLTAAGSTILDAPHPYQDKFVAFLREIIKRKKTRKRSASRPDDFLDDLVECHKGNNRQQ